MATALEYFDGLAAEERSNLPLQRELAAAYEKLGTVLGRPFRSNLGDSAAAPRALRGKTAGDHPLTVCGEGELIKTFLLPGQAPKGKRVS